MESGSIDIFDSFIYCVNSEELIEGLKATQVLSAEGKTILIKIPAFCFCSREEKTGNFPREKRNSEERERGGEESGGGESSRAES